mgnify:CR=1 FL=1
MLTVIAEVLCHSEDDFKTVKRSGKRDSSGFRRAGGNAMSWPMVKLKDCCDVVGGATPKRNIAS